MGPADPTGEEPQQGHKSLPRLWEVWPLHCSLSSSPKQGTGGEPNFHCIPQRLQLAVSICWQNQSLPAYALIDSGTEDFLDSQITEQLHITTVPLEARALNGLPLANVCYKTAPVTLVISANHRKDITLSTTPVLP